MVAGAGDKGHFEIVMDRIGTSLLILVMAWILAAWIGGFWRHIPIASPGRQTLLEYTLVLLIIGVPVGLPVVTTTTMAVGAAYLARRKAIVQKLTAIESLAVSSHLLFFYPETKNDVYLITGPGSRHLMLRQNRNPDCK